MKIIHNEAELRVFLEDDRFYRSSISFPELEGNSRLYGSYLGDNGWEVVVLANELHAERTQKENEEIEQSRSEVRAFLAYTRG